MAALGRVALVMFGAGIALGLMELSFRTNPHLVPAGVRVSPPVRRMEVFSDETYDVELSDGDLFYWMAGKIAPLPPEQDKVVAEVHFTTDGNGFRNILPEKATYRVVALGDSFTVAGNVNSPWPQKLADCTGWDVLNLSGSGLGPQEELELFRQYGLDKRPQWVVLAYFEGNDLYDAAAYDQANPFIVARMGKYMLTQGIEKWRRGSAAPVQPSTPSYLYPITVTVNDIDLEMAFFSAYMAWVAATDELIQPSQNYRLLRETIQEIRELSEAADANLLLVYVPTKEHVYLPYLNDPETAARVFSDVPTLELNEEGFIQFASQRASLQWTRQNRDDQARLLADFSAEQDIAFLDLTPSFIEEAATGAELYYPFDTHWNQQGHNLAAQTIGRNIENLLGAQANQISCGKES